MKVKLFAYLAEKIAPEIEMDLPQQFTAEEILRKLEEEYPQYASDLQTCRIAINQTFAAVGEIYEEKVVAELAVIPPVSGG